MEGLAKPFDERLQEIEEYIQLLEGIEAASQFGPPRLGADGMVITAQQQRILYSGLFLQLYNLVESSVVKCLDAITESALPNGLWTPGDLTEEFRREWIRVTARTHVDLNYENRLVSALNLCTHLLQTLPVGSFRIEKGGGGNWDDVAIEEIASRLGCRLRVRKPIYSAVKRKIKDDLGALGLVKDRRNSLAHGTLSFAECGQNLTVRELRDLTERIANYMREVVSAFQCFIDEHQFVVAAKRPAKIPA